MKHAVLACIALVALAACGDAQSEQPFAEFRGDPEVARAAVQAWAAKGADAIPDLQAGLESDSVKVQVHSRRALSKITGQWGGDGRLLWRRSVEEAKGGDKPLMVLHLFGKFDEEFC